MRFFPNTRRSNLFAKIILIKCGQSVINALLKIVSLTTLRTAKLNSISKLRKTKLFPHVDKNQTHHAKIDKRIHQVQVVPESVVVCRSLSMENQSRIWTMHLNTSSKKWPKLLHHHVNQAFRVNTFLNTISSLKFYVASHTSDSLLDKSSFYLTTSFSLSKVF